ncbi:MAG TPA: histidine-type phosphatase, partial [Chitinophagaceae bacterium]|nr:histidine-type phosphatase [Chitinophagaceae bacterium]
TARGIQLEQMTRRFLLIEAGNYENITGLGRNEQAGIAARMLHNYKKAFRGNGLDVIMTHKVRTQQSADAFLAAFGGYTGKKNYCVVPDSLDNTLRFYDLSPAYLAFKRSEAVRGPVDSLNKDARTKAAANAVCARIFNPGFANIITEGVVMVPSGQKKKQVDAVSFVENLYDLYCVQLSIPVEMQQKGYNRDSINFGIAFMPQDLEWFSFKNGAEDFLEKGAGTDTLGIQVRVALPLLADFLSSTEAAIGNKAAPDARLRFTHAEAIAPFATLLGLPQASIPSSSIYQYYAHWKAESIAPLSANIQWILYSNGKDYLVKALLNEYETALPLPTDTYPFYRWEAV